MCSESVESVSFSMPSTKVMKIEKWAKCVTKCLWFARDAQKIFIAFISAIFYGQSRSGRQMNILMVNIHRLRQSRKIYRMEKRSIRQRLSGKCTIAINRNIKVYRQDQSVIKGCL